MSAQQQQDVILNLMDLSYCLNRRGIVAPPSFLIDEGLILLSPELMRQRGWSLCQHLWIHKYDRGDSSIGGLCDGVSKLRVDEHDAEDKRFCGGVIVKAWPLKALPVNVAGLDEMTLSALGIDEGDVRSTLGAGKTEKVTKSVKQKNRRSRRSSGGGSKSKQRRSSRSEILGECGQKQTSYDSGQSKMKRSSAMSQDGNMSTCFVPCVTVTSFDEWVIQDAMAVNLSPCSEASGALVSSSSFRPKLQAILQGRILLSGMLAQVSIFGENIRLRIDSVVCADNIGAQGGRIASTTAVKIRNSAKDKSGEECKRQVCKEEPTLEQIGGLNNEIRFLQSLLNTAFDNSKKHAAVPRGVLVHGPSGNGKSMMVEGVARQSGFSVEILRGHEVMSPLLGEAEEVLSSTYERARAKAPCIVILDSVDAIGVRRDLPTASTAEQRVTAHLLTLMDGIVERGGSVFVIGTTDKIESLDPALRRPGRFDREVEVTVPDAKARFDILSCICLRAKRIGAIEFTDNELRAVANTAYGFVGADLVALWRETVVNAMGRQDKDNVKVKVQDLQAALGSIKPSALREVAVEVPSVRWDDIGGKNGVKQRLKEAVEWPFSEAGSAMFQSVGIRPPRGILLFGPPGCSKTLLAKAVATESGANFISIKGPELLSKFVGESEKAVRATFRRARAASPCVVFFDEIDALATSRSSPNRSSAESRVLAQLLTELDGIDSPLSNSQEQQVVVLAATNRPDLLDSALVRPGRIDCLVYVGLPDAKERLSILRVCCNKVPIDPNISLSAMANWSGLSGTSGAELAAFVREAALVTMEEDVEHAEMVRLEHFQKAVERVRKATNKDSLQFYKSYMDNARGVLLDGSDWNDEVIG